MKLFIMNLLSFFIGYLIGKFKKVGKTVYYSLDDDHIYQIYKLVKEHIEE